MLSVRPRSFVVALATMVAIGLLAPAAAPAPINAPPRASQNNYDEDTLLVGFQPGLAAETRRGAHASQRAKVENHMAWLNLDIVRLPENVDPMVAAARYEHNPNVAYAHPNWEVSMLSAPNDLLWNDLWGMHNTGQPIRASFVRGVADADIDAPEGWDLAFGAGSFPSTGGVRVGVLDSGIDLAHADLLNKAKACANAQAAIGLIAPGCEDDAAHGTHVAGTIAAIANNQLGVAGAAPNADLAVFKVLNAAGVGFYGDMIAGIRWLYTTGGARIISMSIGGPQDDALDAALSDASRAGVLLIAAAGNDGDSTKNYPAFHPDVVSVAATDASNKRASFSNCNSDVEIAAPGVDVWSTAPGNAYAPLSGTSMATPHVSGVAALVMWKKNLTAAQTRSALTGTAVDLGSAGRDTCFGFGLVNLANAIR